MTNLPLQPALPGDSLPTPRPMDVGGSQSTRSGTRGTGQSEESGSSPAFHVLLERLQSRAQELEETSRQLDDPGELAGAVDKARASLEDARSLSDQLLEAFRQTNHHAAQATPNADATPSDSGETR